MPLRRLGITEEWELAIITGLLMATMFICTEILAKKLDKVNDVHREQLVYLREMQLSSNSQNEINKDLGARLQSIENELKVLKANQEDTLVTLRGKKDKDKQ